MVTNVLSLPDEILLKILKHVKSNSVGDLFSLFQTCTRLSDLCLDKEIHPRELGDYNFLAYVETGTVSRKSVFDFVDKFVDVEAEDVRVHQDFSNELLMELNRNVLKRLKNRLKTLTFVGKCDFESYKQKSDSLDDLLKCLPHDVHEFRMAFCHHPDDRPPTDAGWEDCKACTVHRPECPVNCRHKVFVAGAEYDRGFEILVAGSSEEDDWYGHGDSEDDGDDFVDTTSDGEEEEPQEKRLKLDLNH